MTQNVGQNAGQTVGSSVRQAARLTLVVVEVAIVAIGTWLTALLIPFSSRRSFASRFLRSSARIVLRSMGIALERRGPAPRGPALLVANHLSWIDAIAIAGQWPITVVAKHEIGTWPVIGRMASLFGVILIDRKRHRDLLRVIPLMQQAFAENRVVLCFAEGTTGAGDKVLPFRSALFESAVRSNVPVIPLTVTASATGDVRALTWTGDETLVANIARVAALRGARLRLTVSAAIWPSSDRKELARYAFTRVARRYTAVEARADDTALSDLVKQNFRPIDNSDREILV